MSTDSLTMLIHAQSPYAPGSFNTWTNINDLIGNRWSKATVLSPNGSGLSTKTVSQYVDLGALSGNKLMYKTDNGYVGNTNYGNAGSNPLYTMQGYVILLTTGGGAGDNSQNPLRYELDMYIELFEKIDLTA